MYHTRITSQENSLNECVQEIVNTLSLRYITHECTRQEKSLNEDAQEIVNTETYTLIRPFRFILLFYTYVTSVFYYLSAICLHICIGYKFGMDKEKPVKPDFMTGDLKIIPTAV